MKKKIGVHGFYTFKKNTTDRNQFEDYETINNLKKNLEAVYASYEKGLISERVKNGVVKDRFEAISNALGTSKLITLSESVDKNFIYVIAFDIERSFISDDCLPIKFKIDENNPGDASKWYIEVDQLMLNEVGAIFDVLELEGKGDDDE